ncbi:MAG: phosphoribosylanthranilate isomerase [Verrucomicrobiae bacterium]|nr:phosphoribosylanthranilate isomerase [Verrucomicrobiae bacterium]
MSVLIKICGVKDPSIALEAARAGADFIGLVFHPSSKRLIDVATAQAISSALALTEAKPVAVFTEHSAAEMKFLCDECQIKIAQLHGERSRREHHLLPSEMQRIYVQSPEEIVPREMTQCDPLRDYLLFDYHDPGKGLCFDWNAFRYDGPFPWFLAGGLRCENVPLALQQLQPSGLDVSSGVESNPGVKNLNLIKNFISEVQRHEK